MTVRISHGQIFSCFEGKGGGCLRYFLTPVKEEVYVFARVRLSVCLSVCEEDYSKRRAWIWIKYCVSTDVERLTFEPDPDYSPDAGTGLLSPISYAVFCCILLFFKNLSLFFYTLYYILTVHATLPAIEIK